MDHHGTYLIVIVDSFLVQNPLRFVVSIGCKRAEIDMKEFGG